MSGGLEGFGSGEVAAAGGGGPFEGAAPVGGVVVAAGVDLSDVPDLPGRLVLGHVVSAAECGEVVRVGGAAGGPGDGVVEVAGGGGVGAAGEAAGGVAVADEGFEVGGDGVAGAAGGQDGAGLGVGEDAP